MKAVHLRRAQRDLHHRPRQDGQAVQGSRSSSCTNLAAEGRTILFVGTKRQAQDAIAEEAQRCGMYLRQPALARRPAHQLHHHPAQPRAPARPRSDGDRRPLRHARRRRKSRSSRRRSASSQKNLEGIRDMSRLPDAVFIVDTRKEKIAVDEARKLKIPVIGVVDTNCDPDEVDLRDPGQRRRAARDPAVRRRRSPTRSSRAAASASRRRPTTAADGRRRRHAAARAPGPPGAAARSRPRPRRRSSRFDGISLERRPDRRPAFFCTASDAAAPVLATGARG